MGSFAKPNSKKKSPKKTVLGKIRKRMKKCPSASQLVKNMKSKRSVQGKLPEYYLGPSTTLTRSNKALEVSYLQSPGPTIGKTMEREESWQQFVEKKEVEPYEKEHETDEKKFSSLHMRLEEMKKTPKETLV